MHKKRLKRSQFRSNPSSIGLFILSITVLLMASSMFTHMAIPPTQMVSSVSLGTPENLGRVARLAPLQSLPNGTGDLGAILVNPDGSMTTTIMAVGSDIGGDFGGSGAHWEHNFISIALFRWGDYGDVFASLFGLLTNDSDGGDGFGAMSEFLALLPPNALLMIFDSGTAPEISTWAQLIRIEFQNALGIPFQPIIEIPPLPIPNFTFGISAYAYLGTETQGRDAIQQYMLGVGAGTRRGLLEVVTPTLANDSEGGVAMLGRINLGGFSSPPLTKAPTQLSNESLAISAWASLHKDKFYGTSGQEFNLNGFTGRTGNITSEFLDGIEYHMVFPAGVNITSVQPPDMTNSSAPEGVFVSRNSTTWAAQPSIENIIVQFEGDFPPGLSITKAISPTPPNFLIPGGNAIVTITVENIDLVETIFNVSVDDSHSWDAYLSLGASRIQIVGSTSANFTSLAPGESEQLIYTVILGTEGSYVSNRANVTFADSGAQVYEKSSNMVYINVAYASIIDFLLTLLRDIPWSLPVILIIGLMLLYLVIWIIKAILGLRGPREPSAPPPSKAPPEPEIPDEELPPPPPPPMEHEGPTCFNCGSPIPPGVSFCPACGTKIPD